MTATDGAFATGAEVARPHFGTFALGAGDDRRKRRFGAYAFSAAFTWCQGFRGGCKNPQDLRRGRHPQRGFTGFLRGAKGAGKVWGLTHL